MIFPISGGGTKLFAAIDVIYPAGSTLTCTNGSKILTAETTTGQWVFAIPDAGTWTVTATDGAKSKSKTVEITREGQGVSVRLSYQLVLFDGGDITKITGSWASDTTLINDSSVGFSWRKSYSGSGSSGNLETATKNKIDLSDYETLTFNISSVGGATTWTAGVYVHSSQFGNPSMSSIPYTAYAVQKSTGKVSIDVSALKDSYYVGLFLAYGVPAGDVGGITWKNQANKIWLE